MGGYSSTQTQPSIPRSLGPRTLTRSRRPSAWDEKHSPYHTSSISTPDNPSAHHAHKPDNQGCFSSALDIVSFGDLNVARVFIQPSQT